MPKVSIQATLRGLPDGVPFVPRRRLSYRYRYTVQVRRNPQASWAEHLAADDWNTVAGSAEYALTTLGYEVRIVDNGEPDKQNGA